MTGILRVKNLVKHFAGIVAVEDFSLDLDIGKIHALIGPNGAGKSTAIGLLTGEVKPDSGVIMFNGVDITQQPTWRRAIAGIGHGYQITSVVREISVMDNMLLALYAQKHKRYIGLGNARKYRVPVNDACETLEQFRLGDSSNQLAGKLSHGEQGRLEVAMCLATSPKVLLLDEPMSGMSNVDSEKMLEMLASIKSSAAILLVEHDMDAVFKLADQISVMASGNIIASGTPDIIRRNEALISAYLGEDDA
jgi:branched-chain amino acid transport system ATP-binding protein